MALVLHSAPVVETVCPEETVPLIPTMVIPTNPEPELTAELGEEADALLTIVVPDALLATVVPDDTEVPPVIMIPVPPFAAPLCPPDVPDLLFVELPELAFESPELDDAPPPVPPLLPDAFPPVFPLVLLDDPPFPPVFD